MLTTIRVIAVSLEQIAGSPKMLAEVAEGNLRLNLSQQSFCGDLPATPRHRYMQSTYKGLTLIGHYLVWRTGSRPEPYRVYEFQTFEEALEVFMACWAESRLIKILQELDGLSSEAGATLLLEWAHEIVPQSLAA